MHTHTYASASRKQIENNILSWVDKVSLDLPLFQTPLAVNKSNGAKPRIWSPPLFVCHDNVIPGYLLLSRDIWGGVLICVLHLRSMDGQIDKSIYKMARAKVQ